MRKFQKGGRYSFYFKICNCSTDSKVFHADVYCSFYNFGQKKVHSLSIQNELWRNEKSFAVQSFKQLCFKKAWVTKIEL